MKMDILFALEHKFPSFSKGQRTIAQFILKNYDKAAFMTAARLGEVTGVSESTVVRFAADLGYRGYPGMKKALQEIVRNRLTSVERIEAAESTMDGHDVLKAVLRADINNLQATLGEGDLIIGISYPRYSKRTISAMKFARDHGARCLGMTDSKVSPLNEISDVCLYAKSEMVSFLDSLVAPMSLINALIMAVSARDRERTFETFRELETVWKEYEVYGTVES